MTRKKPNILYILNDHQAYWGHNQVLRPVFDQFAKEGVLFENAYAVCPLCGPARRSMLTGVYPHTHGEKQNDDDHPFDKQLYLDVLAQSEYKQYYYGKWHAGSGTALDHGCEGFNYPSYNNPYTKPEYKAYLNKQGLPEPEIFIEYDFMDGSRQGKLVKQDRHWCNEHCAGVMVTPKETHEAFFLAHLATEKIKEIAQNNDGTPFSMRVDFWGPHQPYFPSQEFIDQYAPKDINLPLSLRENVYTNNKPAIYNVEHNRGLNEDGKIKYPSALSGDDWRHVLARCYAQITMLDEAAGIILNALKEYGLEENTMVIWTTDHGDAVACHGGHFDKASYMPEEMIHVPMALRYSGVVPPGQVNHHFVSNMDVGPTILDAAQLSYEAPVHGLPLMRIANDPNAPWRTFGVCETHGHFQNHIGRAVIAQDYKYIYNIGDLDELYDRENDPHELDNLAVKPEFAWVIANMKELLLGWAQETGDEVVLNEMRQ